MSLVARGFAVCYEADRDTNNNSNSKTVNVRPSYAVVIVKIHAVNFKDSLIGKINSFDLYSLIAFCAYVFSHGIFMQIVLNNNTHSSSSGKVEEEANVHNKCCVSCHRCLPRRTARPIWIFRLCEFIVYRWFVHFTFHLATAHTVQR